MRTFVADGNFSADHLKQKHPEDDVWLLNGRGMMTAQYPYHSHLQVAKDTKSVCFKLFNLSTLHAHKWSIQNVPCDSNFRVLQLTNLVTAFKDATGIGAIACARHGCYCPGSVVDFQKGEKQMNIDWAMCEALKTTNVAALVRKMLMYDIGCTYGIHFDERVERNHYLILPAGTTLEYAIGLFHVHGHKDECFFQFATSFIPGAAIVDGEVLETLWSSLNNISPSTRTATLAHREEVLDDHMGDSNFKKMTGCGELSYCSCIANAHTSL